VAGGLALRRGGVAVERHGLLAQVGDLGLPRVEEEDEVRPRAATEANAAAARAREHDRVVRAVELRLGQGYRLLQAWVAVTSQGVWSMEPFTTAAAT
jgi:hypothetical protein